MISLYEVEIAVVGAGPAGLSAAREAAGWGALVTVYDRDERPGGQLIKQTHRFFGSKAQRAGTRGIHIASQLARELEQEPRASLFQNADVLAYYPDKVMAYEKDGRWEKCRPKALIIATGASERPLAFPGSDLPGVYGAGAIQTLMNVHGVRPGRRVLMVGAGNIGLIVAYQLLQADVEVAGVIEASGNVGGYWVHASKLRRLGVPILTHHSIERALGDREVTGARITELDADWNPVSGTDRVIDCDAIGLAVGLNPLSDLLWQAGCAMAWVDELGGYVPLRQPTLETTVKGIYVAGDATGIEEASAAMMEGALAGLGAAHSLGYVAEDAYDTRRREIARELEALRNGPHGAVIRNGLDRLKTARPITQVLVEGCEH